jgi:hypothetical protein
LGLVPNKSHAKSIKTCLVIFAILALKPLLHHHGRKDRDSLFALFHVAVQLPPSMEAGHVGRIGLLHCD